MRCRRSGWGGQGGHVSLTATYAPPHFSLLKILFLEHHATTRQQTMMEKGIITLNIILLGRFLNSLRNCWQPNAVRKSGAIFLFMYTPLQIYSRRDM